MTRRNRLTAVLSGVLLGLGLRALADVIKKDKPGREKAVLIALLIGAVMVAVTALLWAFNLV